MAAKSKSPSGEPAVSYLRMSSKRQDKSIPDQRTEIEKYAKSNGYRIVREYTDEGISGSESERREGFKRLIRDAQDRKDFKAILCWDQDRFSRFDPMEANYYWYILRDVGIDIVTVAQGRLNFEDLAGWLAASVNQYGKAQFLRDLSRNVLRGKHKALQNGKWIGKPPYAYAKNDGRLVLGDHEHVKVVRWLFEQYAEADISARALQMQLINRGTPGPRGQPWAQRTVLNILRNPVYKGTAVSNRQTKGKFFVISGGGIKPAVAKAEKIKSQDDWIVTECPAIVSPALWGRVQSKLVKRRVRRTPKVGSDFLLSGILHCGHCGNRMIGMKQRGHKAYVCGGYHRFGPTICQCNTIQEEPLTKYLVEIICDKMLANGNLESLKQEIQKQIEAERQEDPSDAAHARRKLKQLDEEIQQTLQELKRTPADLYDLVVADLRRLRSRRDSLANDVKALQGRQNRRADDVVVEVERIAGRLLTLRETLSDADPALARETLSQFCARIDVFFEHSKHGKLTRSRFSRGVVKFDASHLRHHL